jgi:hypothetical protein
MYLCVYLCVGLRVCTVRSRSHELFQILKMVLLDVRGDISVIYDSDDCEYFRPVLLRD